MLRALVFFLLLKLSANGQADKSWFKSLEGRIGKYPVTLLLHKAGNNYRGFYYYNSQQKPIPVSGNDTANKGSIILAAFTPGQNEEFLFTLKGKVATGTWKKNAGSTPITFNAQVRDDPPKFTYVFTEGSIKLNPSLENSPEAGYSAAAIWPTGNSSNDNSLKEIIRSSFIDRHKGTEDIGALLLRDKKQFFDSYRSDLEDVTEDEIKERSAAYNYSAYNTLEICYLSSDIISLARFSYSFTGGAHGNYGTSYTAFDRRKNKRISLADFVNENNRNLLNQLLEKNFRKQYNLKSTDSLTEAGLFENKIEANDNFYITGKGIGFNYTPYEIGPYVLGEIEIFIPFSDWPAVPGPTNRPFSAQEH